MKISKSTLNVLKNFTNINQVFAFKKGSTLLTMSEGKNLVAEAQVAETFDTDFGIYNLSEFMGVISLLDDPDFAFTDPFVTISSGKSKIKFGSTDLSILSIPKKSISFESQGVDELMSFDMSEELYSQIVKTSAVLHAPDIWIVGEKNSLTIEINDVKNPTSNTFSVDLGETKHVFKAHIKIDTLKFIQSAYTVSLAPGMIRFASPTITYHVKLEEDSEV
jgi:hypothetical protein